MRNVAQKNAERLALVEFQLLARCINALIGNAPIGRVFRIVGNRNVSQLADIDRVAKIFDVFFINLVDDFHPDAGLVQLFV